MGLFIHLITNFEDIEPEQWEKTFQESVFLLEKFPAPLMRLIREEVKGQNRYVYTSIILENIGQEDENWRISGDLTSYRHAETFELFRIVKKTDSNQKASKVKDVIFADDNHIDYPSSGSGIDIFGSKTQGYPYHLAILAVGILFESRFPQKVYVIGDIDEGQGENVLKWMNAILDSPVTMPVCLDGKRLWQRLDKLYDNKELAIKRFNTLSREASEKQLETLLSCCDKSTVLKYLLNEINYFSSLSQLGAIHIIFQILNVTQDLNLVIEFIKNARPGENEFSLEELLKVLTSSFITIPYKERRPLSLFARSYDKLMTIEEVFTQILMKMGGAPSAVNFYLSPSELLDLFISYQSFNRDLFRKIIQENEAKCRKKLDEIISLIEQFDKTMQEQEEKESPQDTDKRSSTLIQNILPEEEYLIKQIYSQIKIFKDPEKSSQIMGEQIQKILLNSEAAQEIVAEKDRDDLLTSIYQASINSQIILRESTWADIDSEENLDLLKRILILCLVNKETKNFRDWRTYILEHKNLWPFLSTGRKVEKNQLHLKQKNR